VCVPSCTRAPLHDKRKSTRARRPRSARQAAQACDLQGGFAALAATARRSGALRRLAGPYAALHLAIGAVLTIATTPLSHATPRDVSVTGPRGLFQDTSARPNHWLSLLASGAVLGAIILATNRAALTVQGRVVVSVAAYGVLFPVASWAMWMPRGWLSNRLGATHLARGHKSTP
jgi:hypothetical protein